MCDRSRLKSLNSPCRACSRSVIVTTAMRRTEAQIRILEVEDNDELVYYPTVSPTSAEVEQLCETPFQSASDAVRALELMLNRAIYESVAGTGT